MTSDGSFNALRLAYTAVKGEMGYHSVLTAKKYGFYDARCGGRPFKFQRPYGDYVIRHSMFKFVTAGMHGQSAVECALRLHPLVKDSIGDIARVEIHSQRALMGIMDKTGALSNPETNARSKSCAALPAGAAVAHPAPDRRRGRV